MFGNDNIADFWNSPLGCFLWWIKNLVIFLCIILKLPVLCRFRIHWISQILYCKLLWKSFQSHCVGIDNFTAYIHANSIYSDFNWQAENPIIRCEHRIKKTNVESPIWSTLNLKIVCFYIHASHRSYKLDIGIHFPSINLAPANITGNLNIPELLFWTRIFNIFKQYHDGFAGVVCDRDGGLLSLAISRICYASWTS